MSAMALTAWLTTEPPFSAWSRAAMASWFAWPALSAFCLTVVVISSIEEAVSSSDEDCSSVRCERLALPAEISSAPRCTSAATTFTFETTSAMLSASWLTPRLMASKKPVLPSSSMRLLRSPPTTADEHVLHLLLDGDFLRAVGPLDDRADALALVVADRVGDGAEGAGTEHALVRVGAGEVVEHAAHVGSDRSTAHRGSRRAAAAASKFGRVLRISCWLRANIACAVSFT